MTKSRTADAVPPAPGAVRTARARAREQITREIKDEARRQLATEGAPQLSLRAVARALGMVSSALYRYFPSRDDLLTALIIDAYDSLGESAEAAVAAAGAGSRARWRACCHAVRDWARARPHEYALIYGSPVPGYRAPKETVVPATRVAVAISGVLAQSWAAAPRPALAAEPLPGHLADQAGRVAREIAPGVPDPVMARGLVAFTQLFGMVSFELFGQFANVLEPADDFFAYAVESMADFIGL
jgi:AcrR family transcriptional regulator